jgi:dolichol-phosphate mannosyltransferase
MGTVSCFRKLAIIPVYDQIGTIGKVLAKFRVSAVDEICLVVDCPTESILREIETAGSKIGISIHVIKNPRRMGVGYAIRKGIEYALSHEFDIIVVLAGNNKDDPQEVPRLLEPIVKEGYDYVQGSRFLPGGRRVKNPIFRGIFSRVYPFLWTLVTDIKCTDVTNGFRAYKADIFKDKRINIWQKWLDGYGLEYYLHFKVLKLHHKTKEVAVSKVYPYRHRGGYSKILPLRDWWQIVGPFVYLTLGARK